MKELYFITNLQSGKNAIRPRLATVIDIFTAGGYEVTVRTTQERFDATAAAEYACLCGKFDLIVCSGGDGTLNEVVQGLIHSQEPLPVGYLPCGSTNDFARSMKIPRNPVEAAAQILQSHPYCCDIGLFGGRSFLYVASFGAFTASTYETPQKLKNIMGHLAYLLHGLTLVPTIRAFHIKLEYDESTLEDEFIFGMVTNTASVGGMLRIKYFRLDDGLFEVMLIRKPQTVLDLQRTVAALLNIEDERLPENIVFLRASRLRFISDEEIIWNLDGEYGGEHCDTQIDVHRRAVTFRVGEDSPFNDEEIPYLPVPAETSESAKEE